MGVRNYLIEGVSCSGKTTVCDTLHKQGHHAIHGDRELAYQGDPLTGLFCKRPPDLDPQGVAAWMHNHHIWDVDLVKSIARDHSYPQTFICGGARNISDVTNLFDRIFVLRIDRETLVQRLSTRPIGEFGSDFEEKKLILKLHASTVDQPKHACMINATQPVFDVVSEVLEHCEV